MATLIQEVRYAGRTLMKNPGFTAVAVLALALGIGANSAIFTLINSVLLRPLPYPESDRLMVVMRRSRQGASPSVSIPKFDYWKKNNRVFEKVTVNDIAGAGYSLTGEGDPERVRGIRVSAEFFQVLGVSPAMGRGFLPEEDRPEGGRVVVISHGLWQRRFGGDRALIGKALTLGGESYTVVGVMPPRFQFPIESDLWTPLRPVVKSTDLANYLLCVARLKPGVRPEQAQSDMDRLALQLRQENPRLMFDGEGVRLTSFHEMLVGDVRPSLLVLLGAVGCVLLIACANVANLLLARAATRNKEIAIRMALGAGRARLLRQLLTESALLALAGGAVGVLLGFWGLKVLLALSPARIPLVEIGMDARALGFSLALSLLTGLMFGLVPALHASSPRLSETLKEGTTRATSGSRRTRLRSLLVVGEMALALVLVIGAALMIESFVRLRNVPPGFDPHNVLTMQMSLAGPRFAATSQVDSFMRQALQRIETLPGVVAAATVTNLPLEQGPDLPFDIEGRPEAEGGGAQWRAITPNYFRVMKIPLLRGRSFTEGETGQSAPVVIVNEAFAKRYFPKQDPIGERLTLGRIMGPEFRDATRQIIGVVGDVKEVGLDRPTPPTMFFPCAQVVSAVAAIINRLLPTTWVVRTATEPLSMAPVVRREILAVDRQQPVANIRTMEQVFADSIARQNFNMLLLGVFAGLALLLAAVGIYGVMAYSVSQRTHEIGIRMALGAVRSQMARMVVGQGMVLALAGVLIGLAAAFGLTRLMASLLFGVRPANPVTFAGVSLLLTLVALVASYLPARRAMKVDPIVALRHE